MIRTQILSLSFLVLASRVGLSQELPPGEMILPESALPSYESEIDHARLIQDDKLTSFNMGQKIYQQVCHNCHGDINLPGSIPSSLRFAEGVFQHGNDPYRRL